jgi:homopolymeric O-antigen transport system permease protein
MSVAAAARPSPRARALPQLVAHLARRELESTHRMTVLGWLWPVARQIVQLVVLVFIFSHVLDLGIHNFPVFVFCGLITWTWFSSGIGAATSSLLDRRHLVYQPGVPPAVLPIVAITVPLVDMVMALPVLLVMLATTDGLAWTVVLIPLLVVAQFTLMSGLAWLASAAAVFFRDVPNVVALALTVLFYATPVFYALGRVPERFSSVLHLNPMTAFVEAYRALLLGDPFPSLRVSAYVLALSIALATLGLWAFRSVDGRFVDNL